jgi:hypothetical protein
MTRDSLGLAITAVDAGAVHLYEQALRGLQTFTGDPVGGANAAIAADPSLVMAHVFKGYLYGLSTEPAGLPVARECFTAASSLPMNSRERGHVEALGVLVEGGWHRAGRLLEDVAIDHPLDALAIQVGHQIDFFTGNSRMLRDRVARALPAWQAGMPGHHAILAAHAFGLEETGDYVRAEKTGRRAAELEPLDGWAQHAVAHVMEMQSRQQDGIGWMRGNLANWSQNSFLKVHNWWHLALYHFELGETDEVLALFDGPIFGERSTVALDMVDASALLWRLHLAGVDVGGRWEGVADNWAPYATAGNYAFNDAHAMMAFVGAGRGKLARTLIETQTEAVRRGGDNAAFTRDVGLPAALAIKAFGDGDYGETVRQLRPIRSHANRFGGSHAQRDVLDLTLIEAAIRSGQSALAAALTAERREARPESPLSQLFVKRAGQLQAMAA